MAITAGNKFEFHFGTLVQYQALGTKNADHLYFLTDSKQIYVGEDLYTGHVEFVTEFPTAPSQGTIYVNSATHETKVWNGTSWDVMIPPISSTLDSATVDTNLVTAKAIRDYVASVNNEAVADVAYDASTQKFTVTYGDSQTSELTLENLITGASYNGTTGDFTFTVANGEDVVVNTPKENFLSTAAYDADTHMLTLTLTDGTEVEVDLVDLIDTYTVANSATVNLTMTGNEITAVVNKSATTGNALVLNADGLFVPEALVKSVESTATVETVVSADGKLTSNVKLSATEGNIIEANEDGLFAPTTDLSNYYTKTETDALVSWKSIG